MDSSTRPSADNIRRAVASRYSTIGANPVAETIIPVGRGWAERLGYPSSLLDAIPARALSAFTGVGAPALFAGVSPGQQVLDLGCGAGLDTILLARRVGSVGHVYGFDLALGMVAGARGATAEAGLQNVTIREAAAEALPLADACIDVVVVNGLFNLAADKREVAQELARVLRPGGRLVAAEIVITDERPPRDFDPESWFT